MATTAAAVRNSLALRAQAEPATEKISRFTKWYFSLKGSFCAVVLKIISWMTFAIPALVFALKMVVDCLRGKPATPEVKTPDLPIRPTPFKPQKKEAHSSEPSLEQRKVVDPVPDEWFKHKDGRYLASLKYQDWDHFLSLCPYPTLAIHLYEKEKIVLADAIGFVGEYAQSLGTSEPEKVSLQGFKAWYAERSQVPSTRAQAVVSAILRDEPPSKTVARVDQSEVSANKADAAIIADILDKTPPFQEYRIGQGTPYPNTPLLAVGKRLINFFFEALFGDNTYTNFPNPARYEQFRFTRSNDEIYPAIFNQNRNKEIVVTASGRGNIYELGPKKEIQVKHENIPFTELYGTGAYRLSCGEIQDAILGEEIYVASPLTLRFYMALQEAMENDNIFCFERTPKDRPILVRDLTTKHCRALVQQLPAKWEDYGFSSPEDCERILNFTLYQLGCFVVKDSKYYPFLGEDGKIRDRAVGEETAIQRITLCAIRDADKTRRSRSYSHRQTIKTNFATALAAVGEGYFCGPAYGMGAYGMDPADCWFGILDAIVESDVPMIEKIFINPGHKPTPEGSVYAGAKGEEFAGILRGYKATFAHRPDVMAKLEKVENLFDRKTDLFALAVRLKEKFPQKKVSLGDAADPEHTIGPTVGPKRTGQGRTGQGSNRFFLWPVTEEHWFVSGFYGSMLGMIKPFARMTIKEVANGTILPTNLPSKKKSWYERLMSGLSRSE